MFEISERNVSHQVSTPKLNVHGLSNKRCYMLQWKYTNKTMFLQIKISTDKIKKYLQILCKVSMFLNSDIKCKHSFFHSLLRCTVEMNITEGLKCSFFRLTAHLKVLNQWRTHSEDETICFTEAERNINSVPRCICTE